MKPVAALFLMYLALSSTAVAADGDWEHVGAWLNECAEAVPDEDAGASKMDQSCATEAQQYCLFDAEVADRTGCSASLVAHLNAETAMLVSEKPDTTDLSKFRRIAFDAYWGEASAPPDIAFCEAAIRPADHCPYVQEALRWVSARAAWRIWRLETQ